MWKQNWTYNINIKLKYENILNIVIETSRKNTPRGCRPQYVTELDKTSSRFFEKYKQIFKINPFNDDTNLLEKNLIESVNDKNRQK